RDGRTWTSRRRWTIGLARAQLCWRRPSPTIRSRKWRRRAMDDRERLDVRIDSAERGGLTGTTPASVYRPLHDAEQVTVAPDWRPMDEQPAWRTDFPIDWPQDHYVERRDFMKFMVLTSLAFTVGQFWIAVQNWWRRRRGEPEMIRIAAVREVPVGAATIFSYP